MLPHHLATFPGGMKSKLKEPKLEEGFTEIIRADSVQFQGASFQVRRMKRGSTACFCWKAERRYFYSSAFVTYRIPLCCKYLVRKSNSTCY